jgi:primosomal protein N' (replication factor Y)
MRAPAAPRSDDSNARPAGRVVEVLLPLAFDKTWSYRVPPEMELAPGDVVNVPLGTRESVGVVWDAAGGDGGLSGDNLKAVLLRHDLPPLGPSLRRLVEWIAAYTLAPRGMAARLALRDPARMAPERPRVGLRRTAAPAERLTPARARALAAAEGGLVWPKAELARAAGVSTGVVDALVDTGLLEAVAMPPESLPVADPGHAAPDLSPAQRAAADALAAAVRERTFSTTLLEGVTGSGKTEVYFEAVAEALRQGRQALVMLPEIALTAEFLGRFENRFGVRPAEWHSAVSDSRKTRVWRGCASGEVQVVAGARSALFLPFRELGLIVVDEEHEQAYKQEDGVCYHARDMAVVRARIEGAAAVLASATPSIESRVNVGLGRYRHLRLPGRYGGRALPTLEAVDLTREGPPRGRWLAPRLVNAVRAALERGEQALLFLNRRGYAPLTLCNHCGHRWQCPNCEAWLVEHRFRRALVCHHCGHTERTPRACTKCGAEDSLAACGPGVERLAEEAAGTFPDARMIVLSSDFPGGTERLRRELAAIAAGEFDIVIGTQLVAKGHNFPLLSVVGVVDADVGLQGGDPRAAERTFQLLQQVTGRAGRAGTAGRGLIQTHDPRHPVMRAILSGDQERFYREETELRRAARLPPFGRMASVLVSGPDRTATEAHARLLALAAHATAREGGERYAGLDVLGPAEAPIALIRGRYRFRLLARGPRAADMQAFLRATLAAGPKEKAGIRVAVDVDPMSFL